MKNKITQLILLSLSTLALPLTAVSAENYTSIRDEFLRLNLDNVKAAVRDLEKSFPEYPKGRADEIEKLKPKYAAVKERLQKGDASAEKDARKITAFAHKVLLENPLVKGKNWLVLKKHNPLPDAYLWRPYARENGKLVAMTISELKKLDVNVNYLKLGLSSNWQGNHFLRAMAGKADDSVCTISAGGEIKILFAPEAKNPITDLCLNWDADKILFSSISPKGNWELYEISADGGKPRLATPNIHADIDNYDGVYAPDGRIIFCSTASYAGVPCVFGQDYVGNIFSIDASSENPSEREDTIRQLTFEQDQDWMPRVTEDGRILYTRWEYSDNSHYFSRIVMCMNPDGTNQHSYYGSSSYWPNSLFYCRQIPNNPNMFVGVVSGHHGFPRTGELHLFDITRGNREGEGQIYQFGAHGKPFKPLIKDELTFESWPKFLHPFPLSEKYFVASMRWNENSQFGIYLLDTFGNIVPIKEMKDYSLLEPTPFEKRKRPPVIADRRNDEIPYGIIYLSDIYKGEGLRNVPRGTVKALRIFEYHFAYRDTGMHDIVGYEGPWDVKRVLGTVPVYEDGSASFKVPSSTPISLQPLDADGKALALMRTWTVSMPGETQSCVGCHERTSETVPFTANIASRKPPSEIEPFAENVDGFSFDRVVQPILDRHCVDCHNAEGAAGDGRPNFAETKKVWKHFGGSYLALHPYVRRPGPECYQRVMAPLEYYAGDTELVRMLAKGHKGVRLSNSEMRTLYTWIDLNVPYLGTWGEYKPVKNGAVERRKFFLKKYAKKDSSPETVHAKKPKVEKAKRAEEMRHSAKAPKVSGFPFDAKTAAEKIAAENLAKEISLPLSESVSMDLTLVPSGEFVFGSNKHSYDEGAARAEKISKPFYMGKFEVSNGQVRAILKEHHSGWLDRHYKDHTHEGININGDKLPAVRLSLDEALEFCGLLSKKLGVKVSLPTESQWEWAARAGAEGDYYFDGQDYSKFENLSDVSTKKFAESLAVRKKLDDDGKEVGIMYDLLPTKNPSKFETFIPRDDNVDDGSQFNCEGGGYAPNAFGLYDMLGNVSEWTVSPYTKTLGGEISRPLKYVARGASWRDRLKLARVTYRRDYFKWQKVYNVGFRIVVDDVSAAQKFKK